MALTETSPAPAPAEVAAVYETARPLPPLTSGAQGADHKVVGSAYIAVALVFLLVGGVLGLVLRAQLASPANDLVTEGTFRQLFTYHGVFLVFLFLLPAWTGLATAIVPLQLGARRVAFPRVHATALWLTVAGGAMIVASPFVEGGKQVVTGWSLADPVPAGADFSGHGVDYLILGLGLVLIAAVLAAAGMVATIAKLRAPGLTLRRLPMFSWASLVSSSVLLLAAPVLLAGLVMLFVDREYGGRLLSGNTAGGGGDPLMWPRLFWFAAYPMLWALVVPALGAASEIVAVFARHPIARRPVALAAIAGVGVLAFTGWGGEVAELRPAHVLFALGGLAVLAPVASLVLNWLLTIAEARKQGAAPDLVSGPAVLVLGMVAVVGLGLAASAVSAVDASGDLHANAWATGQRHAMFFGVSTLALVAALHYWAPKLWGIQLAKGMARLEVLLLAGGVLLMAASELALGLQDMPLHTFTYASGDNWSVASLGAAVGGAGVGLGALVVVLDILGGLASKRRKPPVPADPWGGYTLEWATSSPPPAHNFDSLPVVGSDTPLLDQRQAAGPGEPG